MQKKKTAVVTVPNWHVELSAVYDNTDASITVTSRAIFKDGQMEELTPSCVTTSCFQQTKEGILSWVQNHLWGQVATVFEEATPKYETGWYLYSEPLKKALPEVYTMISAATSIEEVVEVMFQYYFKYWTFTVSSF